MVEFFGDLPAQYLQSTPNPYQLMLPQDVDSDADAMNMLQMSATPLGRGNKHHDSHWIWLHFHDDPRMRTTLGHHNVLGRDRISSTARSWQNPSSFVSEGSVTPSKGKYFPTHLSVIMFKPPCQHQGCPYTHLQRLGEAKVPGPQQSAEPPSKWAIGAINPTGLAGKAILFADLPQGIYAISETHLTSRGKVRFNQEMWYAKSPFTLTTGADAPYKKTNMRAVGGKHTGVGFLSSYPARPIRLGWDNELYQTSRLHAATFQVNNHCIAGAVCYGYAHAADSRATQDLTDNLLAQLTMQVVEGFPGPSFIAGDFNQQPGVLSEPLKWESKGWKDIQTWANEQWGILPGPTCCQVTRKDYVYLSPQLQALLTSCSNTFDKFPDHSTLLGLLDFPSKPAPVARWPRPQNIDYRQLSPADIAKVPCDPAVTHSDPTTQYSAICHAFEQHVSRVRAQHGLNKLTPSQCGRGQTLERTFLKPQIVAIKSGRQGDHQPQVNTWTLTHCRWTTQCRRLQHYVKHLHKNRDTATAGAKSRNLEVNSYSLRVQRRFSAMVAHTILSGSQLVPLDSYASTHSCGSAAHCAGIQPTPCGFRDLCHSQKDCYCKSQQSHGYQ